ncbi:MAG: hypothetical protein QXJ06_04990 [Candidatus Aenigmatarchaeota archaeon]
MVTQSVFATSFLISTAPTGWEGSSEKIEKTKIFEVTRYRMLGTINAGYNYAPDLKYVDFAKGYNPSLLIRVYDNLPYLALGYRNMAGMDFSRYDAMWDFYHKNTEIFSTRGPSWHRFEDFFVHWQGDTIIIPKGSGYSRQINNENKLGFPQDVRLFELNRILIKQSNNKWLDLLSNGYLINDFSLPSFGGELYIGSIVPEEMFRFYLKATTTDSYQGIWEYCNLTDINKNCLNWQELVLIEDTTRNFRQSGYIRWQPPFNWQRSSVNGSLPIFYLRFRPLTDKTPPIIKAYDLDTGIGGILRRDYVKEIFLKNGNYRWLWPGWDDRNDKNNDGYIDDVEYRDLINPNATARLKWYARKPAFIYSSFSPGISYSPRIGQGSLFLAKSPYKEFAKESVLNNALMRSVNGYSVDLIFLDNVVDYVGLDENLILFNTTTELKNGNIIYSNGQALEYEGNFNQMKILWFNDYLNLISEIRQILNLHNKFLIVNSWAKEQEKFVENSDFVFIEGIIRSDLNWVGWLQRQRQVQKWSKLAKKGALIQIVYGLTDLLTNNNANLETKEMWDRDKIFALATFLAFMDREKETFLYPWKGGWYGSGNARGYWASNTPDYFNFQIPPTPKTVAYYIPAAEYNFGKPTGVVPVGYNPPVGDWHGTLTTNGLYVYQSGIDPTLKNRTDISDNNKQYFIFARDFENGIKVLIRPLPIVLARDPDGLLSDAQYTLSSASEVYIDLKKNYRLLNVDGKISSSIFNKISLKNGEAAILIPSDSYQPTIADLKKYFKISLFSEKEGDIINYSAYLRNISTTTLIKTKVFFPLPSNEKYIDNSAYLTIDNVKYPVSYSYSNHQLRITIPYLSPKKHVLLRWKMRR